MLMDLVMVVIGGGLGAALRYLVAFLLPPQPDGFPWATFLVNIAGCFTLGVISGLAVRTTALSKPSLLFLGTGLCGGFTTFSTFSMEAFNLFREGHVMMVSAYILGSLIGGLGAAALGVLIVRYETP